MKKGVKFFIPAIVLMFVLSGCMMKQNLIEENVSEDVLEVSTDKEETTEFQQNIDTEQMADTFQNFTQESDTEEEQLPETGVYDTFLSEVYELIENNSDEMLNVSGLTGVYEATRELSREDAFSTIGYHIEDVNNDGVDDLMIGYINNETDSKFYGSLIYGLYTYIEGTPTCLLEGYARNRVSWRGENQFISEGSAGAIYYIFSTYELVEGETEFRCIDYYFTSEKDGNFEDVRAYYNNTGEWDTSVSQELECTLDEFWVFIDEYSAETETIEFIPFSEWNN